MIKDLFSAVVNMTITGTVAIIGVLSVRMLFKKMPKVYSYMLWGIVLFRLLCPYSLSLDTSVFNALPSVQSENGRIKYTVPQTGLNNIYSENTDVLTDDVFVAPQFTPESEVLPQMSVTDENTGCSPVIPPPENKIVVNQPDRFSPAEFIPFLWICGAVYLFCANLLTLWETKKLLRNSLCLNENIYINSSIPTAFITGVIKPKIYIPDNLDSRQTEYVILHEQTHIRRKDYIFKLLGFAALCLHWFNPAVWLAFRLAEKDMEMSCDEAVIKNMSRREKRRYSTALLTVSAGRIPGNTAIAFSEGVTTDRIKNVLEYIKPKQKYIITAVLVICAAVAVLAFNPAKPTVYSVGSGKEKCSELLLTNGDYFKHLTGENYDNIAKQLKKMKVLPMEKPPEETAFTGSVIFMANGQPSKLYFDGSYNYMAVPSAENNNEIRLCYRVENPQDMANLAADVLRQPTVFRPVEITYPAFDERFSYDENIAPFTASFELPENLYIADKDRLMFSNWHNTAELYDDGGNEAGSISFCTHLSKDGYSDGNYPARYYLDNANGYDVIYDNDRGHLLNVHNGNDSIFYLYDSRMGCIVKLHLYRNYCSDENLNKIAETLSVSPATDYKDNLEENQPKFRVKPDESREGIAYTAAERYLDFLNPDYDYKLLSARMLSDEEIKALYAEEQDYDSTENIVPNAINTKEQHSGAPAMIKFYYDSGAKYLIETEFEAYHKDTDEKLHQYNEKSYILVAELKNNGQENHVISGWTGNYTDYAPHLPTGEIQTVEVERIATFDYGMEVIKDDTKNLGTTETTVYGERGITKQTVVQQVANGIVLNESVVNTVTLKEPVNMVVAHGTLWNGVPIRGGSGRLIWPTAGGRVTRGYVDQYPNHNGVDIAAPIGTHIYAAADGVVTKALYTSNGYGVYLEIEHGGYQTLYGQCSRLLVSTGQEVKQGQVVAYMGSTGNSTGPHLHFEVKEGSVRYDPYEWF